MIDANYIFEARTATNDDLKQSIEYTEKWLAAQWSFFNKKYFGGKLKKPLEFKWKRMKSYGVCSYDYDPKKNKIVCTAISIGRTNQKSYRDFRDTLVHEMVHQWAAEAVTKTRILAANAKGKARSRKWWYALSIGGRDGHSNEWREKCEELMRADKTLILQKYGTDASKINAKGKAKAALVDKTKGYHLVVWKESIRRMCWLSQDSYETLLSLIKSGSVKGTYEEFTYDANKIAGHDLHSTGYGGYGRYYSIGFFEELQKEGAVNSYGTKLGGVPVEKRRRTKSFFGW